MSNHSPDFDPEMKFAKLDEEQEQMDKMRQSFIADELRKAQERMTERFPEGKLTPQDEGGMHFAIGVKDGKVCIQFAEPCAWIGMPPEQAMEMAQLLIKHARRISKTPFTLQVGGD